MTKIEQSPEYLAAKTLGEALNNCGFNADYFALGICRQHKTVQQAFIRAIIPALRKMARSIPDDRNREAVHWCEELYEAGFLDDVYLPLI